MYTYLSHHGIKGQKWGVQNGPPYPLERQTMQKGTRLESVMDMSTALNRVVFEDDKYTKRPLYTYNPNDEWDRKVYRGAFAVYKSGGDLNVPMYKAIYETKKTLKMPTSQQRIDEFEALAKSNPNQTLKDLKDIRNQLQKFVNQAGSQASPQMKKSLADWDGKTLPKNETELKACYSMLQNGMENVSAWKTTQKYVERMASKYDAMVDDNNVNVYNLAHDPVIVFNVEKSLRYIDLQSISANEIAKSYAEVKNELKKQGLNIQL